MDLVRTLLSRPLYTLLVVVGVSLGTASFLLVGGVAAHFQHYSDRFSSFVEGKIIVRERGGFLTGGALREEKVASFSTLPGVEKTIPILLGRVSPGEIVLFGFPRLILGVPPGQISYLYSPMKLVQGRWPRPGEDACVAGIQIASDLSLQIGKKFQHGSLSLPLVGILERSGGQEDGTILVPLAALQRSTEREGLLSYAVIIPQAEAKTEDLLSLLRKGTPSLDFLSPKEIQRQISHATIIWRILGAGGSIVAILMAFFVVLHTMSLAVFTRSHEIGLKKAVGATSCQLLLELVTETTVMSLLGSLSGSLLALAFASLLNHWGGREGMILIALTPPLLIQGASLSLLGGFLGGIFPFTFLARIHPAEIMRR